MPTQTMILGLTVAALAVLPWIVNCTRLGRIFLNNLDHPINLTNGPEAPGADRFDPRVRPQPGRPLEVLGFELASVTLYFYLFLALAVASVVVCSRLQDARIGAGHAR